MLEFKTELLSELMLLNKTTDQPVVVGANHPMNGELVIFNVIRIEEIEGVAVLIIENQRVGGQLTMRQNLPETAPVGQELPHGFINFAMDVMSRAKELRAAGVSNAVARERYKLPEGNASTCIEDAAYLCLAAVDDASTIEGEGQRHVH